jgi:hypothetical protein
LCRAARALQFSKTPANFLRRKLQNSSKNFAA